MIAVNPSNPTQIFEGSDGGVIRTSGDVRRRLVAVRLAVPNGGPRCRRGGQLVTCKRLLSRVPTVLEHIDRKLSSTLQFINVAINPSSTCGVMGGTQDNGTWSNRQRTATTRRGTQVIYGDGGNAGYDATNRVALQRVHERLQRLELRERESREVGHHLGTGRQQRRGAAFYWPQIADPNPVPGAHPTYSGAKHVWRSWAFGAGVPGHVPQDKTPDIAGYEATARSSPSRRPARLR